MHSLQKICFGCLFLLILICMCSCKEKPFKDNPQTTCLQFEDTFKYSRAKKTFFQIDVNLDKEYFTKPSIIANPNVIGLDVNILESEPNNKMEVAQIVNKSKNERWEAVRVRKYIEQSASPQPWRYWLYIVDNNDNKVRIKWKIQRPIYFVDDSDECIVAEDCNIIKIDLQSDNKTLVHSGCEFINNPNQKSLLIFEDGKIELLNLFKNEEAVVGKYTETCRESGAINENWGYFLTSPFRKGGGSPTRLQFINRSNYKIISYPYSFPAEGSLVNIIYQKSNGK